MQRSGVRPSSSPPTFLDPASPVLAVLFCGAIFMRTQAEKGKAFRELHHRDNAFIIPNPWDAGTTRLLEHLGFEAVATTSAGYAFSMGKVDGEIGRDEMIRHV